jgi:hypothetical protein
MTKIASAAGENDRDRARDSFLKGMGWGVGTAVATTVLGPVLGPIVAIGFALANGGDDDGSGVD